MKKPDLDDLKYRQDPSEPPDTAVRGWHRYVHDLSRWYRVMGARLLAAFRKKGILRAPTDTGFSILHRSTKTRGFYQLTFFDENGEPWGDTESENLESLIKRMLEELPRRRRR